MEKYNYIYEIQIYSVSAKMDIMEIHVKSNAINFIITDLVMINVLIILFHMIKSVALAVQIFV